MHVHPPYLRLLGGTPAVLLDAWTLPASRRIPMTGRLAAAALIDLSS
jgi:hypothetical protein